MLQQYVHQLFCIFMLLNLEGAASIEFGWKLGSYDTSKYNVMCHNNILRCKNLTAETFPQQCLIHEYGFDSSQCNTFEILNSKLTFVNKTMLPHYLHELTISSSHVQMIAKDTFNDSSMIRMLNLQYNEITAMEFVDNLINLQILNLGFNKLQHPIQGTTFNRLQNLRELYLDNNILSSIEIGAFKMLQNLIRLQLNNNQFQIIDSNMFTELSKLQILNLSFNKLEYVAETMFEKLKNLEELYLHNNNLQSIKNGTFRTLNMLRKLQVNNNKLQSIKLGTFRTLKMLRIVRLAINHVQVVDANINNLQILNLAFNKLKYVAETMFEQLSNLEELYLGNNNLQSLKPGTFRTLKMLRILQLNYNQLQVVPTNAFISLENVKEINLEFNKLEYITLTAFENVKNLEVLYLNNNFIKNVPLGTFKNFPNLQNLQLGSNYLSQFKTGTFSNLRQLKYLNLSYNNFATINEIVLYPLINLELLDLSNNNFTYINYTSLLMHLPNLEFISIKDNDWSCQLLTNMLKTFRARSVNYLFNESTRYTEENVDGIYCTDNPTEDNVNLQSNNNLGMRNVEGITDFTNITALIADTLIALKQSISKLTNSYNPSLYIICYLIIVFSVLLICVSALFTVYKKYFKIERHGGVNSRSAIELLNTST